MFGIEGIEAVKFAPGVLGVEPPVNGGSGGISLRDQGLDLPPEVTRHNERAYPFVIRFLQH